MPEFPDFSSFNAPEMPKIQMPKFEMPDMPEFEMPEVRTWLPKVACTECASTWGKELARCWHGGGIT